MRLQLVGTYSLEEFESAISGFMTNLRENQIDTVAGVNLYFQPCVRNSVVKLYDDEGVEIDHMLLDYARHRKFTSTTGNLSVVSAKKMVARSNGVEK